MRFLLILLVVAMGILAWAWWVRPHAAGASWIVEDPPSEARLDRLAALVSEPARFLGIDLEVRESSPRRAVRAALARVVIAWRIVPVLVLVTTSAILAGLIVRESARFALRFSSPTLNFLGKRLAAVALVGSLALPILPAGVPPWSLYVLGVLFAMGVGTYVANLPVKL
jgi:hypothetical protein